MSCPVFEKGGTVVCRIPRGYMFTKGKEYTVIAYDPPDYATCPTYTFPAYVCVLDDLGIRVMAHAYRFTKP